MMWAFYKLNRQPRFELNYGYYLHELPSLAAKGTCEVLATRKQAKEQPELLDNTLER